MIRAEYNRGSEREEGASWACGRSGLEEQRCLTSTRLCFREANSFQEKGRAEQLLGLDLEALCLSVSDFALLPS